MVRTNHRKILFSIRLSVAPRASWGGQTGALLFPSGQAPCKIANHTCRNGARLSFDRRWHGRSMATAFEPHTLLSELPMGRAHVRIIVLCFFAWIFDFYDLILYSFLLVPIARELRLSAADSSLALGTSLLM